MKSRDTRWRRRLRVSFWKPGNDGRQAGYTTNVSSTGMFVATPHPQPPGTRLRLLVDDEGNGFVVEAEVVRAMRAPQGMQSVVPSGMGVRFLRVTEIIGTLVPETARGRKEPTPDEPTSGSRYRVMLDDLDQLRDTYHRDLATGGLFVPCDEPPEIDERVRVDLVIADLPHRTIVIEGKVVHRIESGVPGMEGQPNLLAGIGVELLSPEAVRTQVEQLLGSL